MLILYSAAQLAMLVLRNGGTSLDAVEAAIKLLEDREITNAGYGSNLAMDGVVECDASVVDHYGRSGAVGAVARKPFTPTGIRVLMSYGRDQESYIPSTNGPRPHPGHAIAPPGPSKSLMLSRSHRLCHRDGHANPTA